MAHKQRGTELISSEKVPEKWRRAAATTVIVDWDGQLCILCRKEFEDGTAARASRGGVRVLTDIGWFRGCACTPCITHLASRALPINANGTFEQLDPSDHPAFTSFADFGNTPGLQDATEAFREYVEEYKASEAFEQRAKLNDVLRRTAPEAEEKGSAW